MPIEQMSGNMAPSVTALATVYAGAAPGANTNIFTPVKVSPKGVALRLTIALTTGSKVDIRVTDGSTAYSQTLNNDTALTAGCLYVFEFGARRYSSQPYTDGTTAELSYSVRVKTDSVIQTLLLEEIAGVL